MTSQTLQMSDWSTTETYPSHHQDLSKGTNENKIVPNDAWVADVNQHHSNDQSNRGWILSSKLSECYTSLSPYLYGLLLGVVVAGLILAVITALWLTSSQNTLTTTVTTTTTTTATTSTATSTSTTTSLGLCDSTCITTSISNTSRIAFYTFDSVLTDSSGSSNTLSGTYQSFVTGYVNNAASFVYADSQRLYSSQIMNFYQQSWTIEFWFLMTASTTSDSCFFGQSVSISNGMELFLQTKNNVLYFGFFGDDTSGTTTIATNTWYHVAWVVDYTNRIRQIYMNG
ncbi:unnamed protein product [Rotaria sordida]|uniref:Uncharacterized protein n=2 Tax=Rotaria sordida TaxID=392033 RepID=A0A814SYZ3_9BILA|nr:unnamed protein product [Rotaria sordida]CAF1396272.1 unnamed protein product [Rotaria sordida]